MHTLQPWLRKLSAVGVGAVWRHKVHKDWSHWVVVDRSQAIPDRKFGSWAGVSSSPQVPQAGSSQVHREHVPMLPGSSALSHKPKVTFPSFLDDLRLGFPSGGLSRWSHQWWGSKESEGTQSVAVGAGRETDVVVKEQSRGVGSLASEGQETGQEEEAEGEEEEREVKEASAASVFARKRKRGAVSGRRALRLALSRGYSAQKVGDRESALLRSVFGEHLPSVWHATVV